MIAIYLWQVTSCEFGAEWNGAVRFSLRLPMVLSDEDIKVTLSKRSKTYNPLETVSGKAVIHFDSEGLHVSTIEAKLHGQARVEFRKNGRKHVSEEQYHDKGSLLYYTAAKDKSSFMTAGTYTYPFKFQLAKKIPTSFEGKHGWVRYWIEVTVQESSARTCMSKATFNVVNPLKLDTVPLAGEVRKARATKSFCCTCCRSGPLSAYLTLSQSGYAPNERINLSAKIDNESRLTVTMITAKLYKTISYFAEEKLKMNTSFVNSVVSHVHIVPKEAFIWNGTYLIIPAKLPPSGLKYCNSIDIDYWLEVKFYPGTWYTSLVMNVPIIIGNVPLSTKKKQKPSSSKSDGK